MCRINQYRTKESKLIDDYIASDDELDNMTQYRSHAGNEPKTAHKPRYKELESSGNL